MNNKKTALKQFSKNNEERVYQNNTTEANNKILYRTAQPWIPNLINTVWVYENCLEYVNLNCFCDCNCCIKDWDRSFIYRVLKLILTYLIDYLNMLIDYSQLHLKKSCNAFCFNQLWHVLIDYFRFTINVETTFYRLWKILID